ncbi:MAG: lysophospholipid acyltransferase family protein [Bacteroidetes bacterium]|nr:lysophospholipid acyltransferase family protein [Bacteroidota bacterium]
MWLLFLSYLLRDKQKSQSVFIYISKIWMRVWLVLVGCPIRIVGTANFKKGETYIITINHNTLLDIPISCPFIPSGNKTIAKSSFTKVPLFGLFYAKGAVLVDRKNEKSRRESFYEMKDVLKHKIHMCIYPEGTRNRTKEPLKSFYDGAFKLAAETQVSIIPTLIFNTNKAMPNNKLFYLLPHKLEMHFLPAIPVNNQSAAALKEKVYNTMLDYYTVKK